MRWLEGPLILACTWLLLMWVCSTGEPGMLRVFAIGALTWFLPISPAIIGNLYRNRKKR